MKKGDPSRKGRTARRVTWTCQEGSGSLLGNFVTRFVADRLVGIGRNRFDFVGTGKPHDRRHPSLCPFLNLSLADKVAGEDALGSTRKLSLLRCSVATDQFGTTRSIERFERASLCHAVCPSSEHLAQFAA